jgi:hypothetical protein
MVAVLSLGAVRPFALRPKSGGPGLRLQIGHGDLLVMGGSCQRTWQHAIPKTARCLGARISIQFRPDWGNYLGKPTLQAPLERERRDSNPTFGVTRRADVGDPQQPEARITSN